MSSLQRTVFFSTHQSLGAKLVDFGGWEMPIQYPAGIMAEHMACRQNAGIFDVSHMGRLHISGADALPFLQHVLTNNAAALEVGEAQYTLIQNAEGGALDDAYLYRFDPEVYLLVVNASNREKDLAHFATEIQAFPHVTLVDRTGDQAMISLQGPRSRTIMETLITRGSLPEPARNQLSSVEMGEARVDIARTGYTGEPLGFELFVDNAHAVALWEALTAQGADPIGLGARDTLRLEAGLPLYGHELGMDAEDKEIPLFASKLSKFAVSFSPLKKEFIGKAALAEQFSALGRIMDKEFSNIAALPRMVMALAVTGKGIAREGYPVYQGETLVGHITSGTMVPYQAGEGSGLDGKFSEKIHRRALCLALVDSRIQDGDELEIEIRKKRCTAVVVPYHMSSEAPPHVRAIPHDQLLQTDRTAQAASTPEKAKSLVFRALANHGWRRRECINLIPSEMSQSPLARLLSVSDPVNRYAEHKEIKAFSHEDVFYYQGTEFINEVETALNQAFREFFQCASVESRVISGQMANTAVFSAMVDYLNRADRKSEQRRMRKVMNNHIIKGGHLSAQPMGALRDFVARDPQTERAAVVNFPMRRDNPYEMDVEAAEALIAEHRPELVILGKSMILHREPVAEIRAFMDAHAPEGILLYDMAHVLGLYGPDFQEPLAQGADFITGSTHKTFFGTQRGVIAGNFTPDHPRYELWEAIQRRTFPGSVSNHHLGTMTGLLMAAHEMNQFKAEYQKAVLANAKAFAMALREAGLDVAGDPAISFTETHQVVLNVGYGTGARVARDLEANNIIVNYQATPAEEGFTASGALRMGVAEMTRFGMGPEDFATLADLMADLILRGKDVAQPVQALRRNFMEMQYCFKPEEFDLAAEQLCADILG